MYLGLGDLVADFVALASVVGHDLDVLSDLGLQVFFCVQIRCDELLDRHLAVHVLVEALEELVSDVAVELSLAALVQVRQEFVGCHFPISVAVDLVEHLPDFGFLVLDLALPLYQSRLDR